MSIKSNSAFVAFTALALCSTTLPSLAGAITQYSDRTAFNIAVGPNTTDTFGPNDAFPITTGVLNSSTSLVTNVGGPIVPGLIQPNVTYSAAIGTGFFFNIDAAGGFVGGFLDALNDGPITATFANPIAAFGFDDLAITFPVGSVDINFVGGASSIISLAAGGFFGFQSSLVDISSVVFTGTGADVGFDNFSITAGRVAPPPTGVPEPLSLSLFGAGILGAAALRHRNKKKS